jgi:acyl-CoA synthetase (AMP-forming)/AMP-acid ligase II
LPTCLEFVEYFFAIALCGAVAVPVNARYRAHELRYVIENGDLVTLITTSEVPEQVNFIERLLNAMPSLGGQSDPMLLHVPEAPSLAQYRRPRQTRTGRLPDR